MALVIPKQCTVRAHGFFVLDTNELFFFVVKATQIISPRRIIILQQQTHLSFLFVLRV